MWRASEHTPHVLRTVRRYINPGPGRGLCRQPRVHRLLGRRERVLVPIAEARARAAEDERREVAAEIRALLERSGLSRAAFAERIGTSVPRLSTYLSGKVTPSAALVVRMRRVAANAPRR